jgi:hypothetical protein
VNLATNSRKQLAILLSLIAGIIVIVCVYQIARTIYISQTTGILKVSSSDNQAAVSVTQSDRQAAAIGVGSVGVHLAPGTYLVAVSDKGQQATSVVHVSKKSTTKLSLNPDQEVYLPSVLNITFNNMSDLVNTGISATQATNIEEYFFKFMPTAHTVTISPASIEPGPHDAATSTGFTTNFTVNVDNTSYNGTINYSNLDNVELILTNPQTGATVFDSGSVNS